MSYKKFLEAKRFAVKPSGFTPDSLPEFLFDYQKEIITRALQAGKFAAFTATGTGKTAMELSWAKTVCDRTGGSVLILAPLAVAKQTAYIEAEKFGFIVNYCESDADVVDGINITNYEKLHKIDTSKFIGVVLDESSCLKSFSSKTRNQLIDAFGQTPYRFACTATPAPNDFMELGNHSEFLGVMSRTEMLATFFTHDGGNTSQWRLKKHGLKPFWEWMSEWSVVMQKPSDLGYSDDGFELPPLNQYEVKLETGIKLDGELFVTEARSLTEQRQAKRLTLDQRVAEAVKIIGDSKEQWLVWCHLNDESDALTKAIAGAVEVKGSDSDKHKEDSAFRFAKGEIQILVSKPDIFGYGLNFQSCHNMIFVGLNHSFEMLHQSIRRCWRYGQDHPVNVYLICADVEGDVLRNIQRKEAQFQEMIQQSVKFSQGRKQTMTIAQKDEYKTARETGDNFTLYLGDSCEVMQSIESDSVGFSVFSPPFSSLYTYSNSERDLGNCKGDGEFMEHFKFIVQELYRVLIPGRLVSFHCMDLPVSKQSFGYIGIRDFRGDLIRLFESVGFVLHSQVVIWKDPVTAMQRTKAIGLLHKQLEKDSSLSRQGIPDYLVTMRKLGDNPVPIAGKLTEYYGDGSVQFSKDEKRKSIEIWQRYASPVWMDINMSDTLQYMQARENDDERHICLAKNSLVLTYHKGYVPIQDLEVGKDLVLTHKGRWMPVIAKQKTSDRADVVSIKAAGVSGLTVTPTHKLWARTCDTSKGNLKSQAMKSNPQWVEAKDLTGQYINFQLPPTEEESKLTEQEWWIVGRWLADGHIATGTTGRTSLHISVGSHKFEEFMAHAREFAGTQHQPEKNCIQVRIKDPDRRLRDTIANCGKKSYEKRIPPEAYRLPRQKAKALLDGIMSGDGHLDKQSGRWYLSSVSKNLLLGVQALILRVYGVTSTLQSGRGERQSQIEGRTVNCRQEWILSFQTESYGFSFVMDDGAWKKVKSISDAGQSETWNIQVLEDASYTAEGCIVKNCPLQLGVIRRALQLWSIEGDIILDPFNGIGSTGYCALEMGRKYIGVELKKSYYDAALKNLRHAENNRSGQLNLFA